MRMFVVAVRLVSDKRTFVRKVVVYSMLEVEARVTAVVFCHQHYSSRKEDFGYHVDSVSSYTLEPRFYDV